jgi:hypothetical protein
MNTTLPNHHYSAQFCSMKSSTPKIANRDCNGKRGEVCQFMLWRRVQRYETSVFNDPETYTSKMNSSAKIKTKCWWVAQWLKRKQLRVLRCRNGKPRLRKQYYYAPAEDHFCALKIMLNIKLSLQIKGFYELGRKFKIESASFVKACFVKLNSKPIIYVTIDI